MNVQAYQAFAGQRSAPGAGTKVHAESRLAARAKVSHPNGCRQR